eukprot:g38491.t1
MAEVANSLAQFLPSHFHEYGSGYPRTAKTHHKDFHIMCPKHMIVRRTRSSDPQTLYTLVILFLYAPVILFLLCSPFGLAKVVLKEALGHVRFSAQVRAAGPPLLLEQGYGCTDVQDLAADASEVIQEKVSNSACLVLSLGRVFCTKQPFQVLVKLDLAEGKQRTDQAHGL